MAIALLPRGEMRKAWERSVMHCGDCDSHQHRAAQPSRDAPASLRSQVERQLQRKQRKQDCEQNGEEYQQEGKPGDGR